MFGGMLFWGHLWYRFVVDIIVSFHVFCCCYAVSHAGLLHMQMEWPYKSYKQMNTFIQDIVIYILPVFLV